MNIKSKALLAYVVIFLVGGASGFFLNEAIRPQVPGDRFERRSGINNQFPGSENDQFPQRMRNYFIRELDLEENQIEPFFDIQRRHLQKIHESVKEYKREEMDMLREKYTEFIDDVEEILTREQLRELNRIAHPDSVHQRRMQRRRFGEGR